MKTMPREEIWKDGPGGKGAGPCWEGARKDDMVKGERRAASAVS